MKVLILCLLIGSISAINQSQKDFQEVATSRVSSGCIDRLPRLPSACKNVKVTCSKLKSQCHKTLAQVVKPAGRKCQSKLRKADANKKIYQFCAGSCTTCSPALTSSNDGGEAAPAATNTESSLGISLNEYQTQVDVFRQFDEKIDGLVEKLLSQDALIQGLKQNVSAVKGDLSDEKTAREKSDQEEKESREQSDAQIQDDVEYVKKHMYPVEAITGYTYGKDTYCRGPDLAWYPTLDAATAACRSEASCGCIWNHACDGIRYRITVGTSTKPSEYGACSWVKT